MVGIILTGHGKFAGGLLSAVKLIAGDQESIVSCDFLENDSTESLDKDLKLAIKSLKERCSGVIIFTDLRGGSPFQRAVTLSQKEDNIEVLAGSNLPMILEVVMARNYQESIDELVQIAINTGREQVYHYLYQERKSDDSKGGI